MRRLRTPNQMSKVEVEVGKVQTEVKNLKAATEKGIDNILAEMKEIKTVVKDKVSKAEFEKYKDETDTWIEELKKAMAILGFWKWFIGFLGLGTIISIATSIYMATL